MVKLNFSLAIGLVRGKSWGGLHDWLPVPQRPNHLCFISFCSQGLHLDKWSCGLVTKMLALGPLVSKRSWAQLLPGSFVLPSCLCEAPGRQERIHWTACEAPGRQERIHWTACEAPGRLGSTVGCLCHRQDPEPGCVVKLNFSLAIGLVRGKSWGGLHGWLPVAQTSFWG